jgi:hypothetical protein
MSYVLIRDGLLVREFRRPPNALRRVDDGAWMTKPADSVWSPEDMESSCLVEVVDTPRPDFDREVESVSSETVMVDSVPTVVWALTPLSAEELAERAVAAERKRERKASRRAIGDLRDFRQASDRGMAEVLDVLDVMARTQIQLIRDSLDDDVDG